MRLPWPLLILIAVLLLGSAGWLLWRGGADEPQLQPLPEASPAAPNASPAVGGVDGAQRALVLVDQTVTATLRVRGRILDDYGQPVGGALVGEVSSERPIATTAAGLFAFVVNEPPAAVTVMVIAEGHAPHASTHAPGNGIELDLGDVLLRSGGRLRGTVVDAAGTGLGNATVRLRALAPAAWPTTVDLSALLVPVRTDAQGRYAFAHLVPGLWEVTASAPDLQVGNAGAVTVRAGEEVVVPPIVLGRAFVLAGLVIGPDERPVAAATVRVVNAPTLPRFAADTTTASDGRFELRTLPAGILRLEVNATGFLRHGPIDVDAARGDVVRVQLRAGLRLQGSVVDANTGRPVERFAACIERLGNLDPGPNGTAGQQLERRLETLRTAIATSTDAGQRDTDTRLLSDLQVRLANLQEQDRQRPTSIPTDVGEMVAHADGEFAFDGLQEGLYTLGIASPEHAFARSPTIELRAATTPSPVVFTLVPGNVVHGVVVRKMAPQGIARAHVELLAIADEGLAVPTVQRSLFPWLFARAGNRGLAVATVTTDPTGAFTFPAVAPGRYAVAVRNDAIADHETDSFELRGRREVRIEVVTRASLEGRVANAASQIGGVEVLVLGGHGTMRTTKVAVDGSYRFEGLQPGDYLVRAYPTQATQYSRRLLGSLFPEHASAVAVDKLPPRDVQLAGGERRVLDLAIDLPATGSLQGTLMINGRPVLGSRVLLRPVAEEAPGAGGLSLRGEVDAQGRFTIGDVPVGNYHAVALGATRQELASQPVTVNAAVPTFVHLAAAAGGVRGRVLVNDGTLAADLVGSLWVLPGAKEEPADLHEYRRSQRTHRLSVRNGAFRDEALTSGAALMVLELRGRRRVVVPVVIPEDRALDLELTAGDRDR